MKISNEEIKRITNQFFGYEHDGQRCKGLVDHESEEDFDRAFDVATFLERLKKRVFDTQQQEMVRAIRGPGEYRLVDKSQAISPTMWKEMTKAQRKKKAEKILHTELNDEPFEVILPTTSLSLSFDDFAKRICHLPLYRLKRIFSRADFIRENHRIENLVSRNYCVPDVEFAATVSKKAGYSLRCTCNMFLSAKSICAHTLAVADHAGFLSQFLDQIERETQKSLNEMLNNNPKQAGLKPKEKKKRKGKNNVTQKVIENEYTENDLDFPVACDYSEFYHNEEFFHIVKITSKECSRAKACISCKMVFPKRNPSISWFTIKKDMNALSTTIITIS